jgi:hypothetical protein
VEAVSSDPDSDLRGRGAHRWLRILWCYVRKGRGGGRDLHRLLRHRFASHWALLEREVWLPLIERSRERSADRWGKGMLDWRWGLLAIVAETAYWWARDIEADPKWPQAARDAAAEVRRLDKAVLDHAQRMAEALQQRTDVLNRFGIDADWSGPGPDLWNLLERLAELPRFMGTVGDSQAGLKTFLRYMRSTSRPTPDLADLLALLHEESVPGEPYAHDSQEAEAIAKAQGRPKDVWPERVRLFFASIEEQHWQDRGGQEVTALDCFTPSMLATLLRVAAGFNPHDDGEPKSLLVENIERAVNRYRAARAARS